VLLHALLLTVRLEGEEVLGVAWVLLLRAALPAVPWSSLNLPYHHHACRDDPTIIAWDIANEPRSCKDLSAEKIAVRPSHCLPQAPNRGQLVGRQCLAWHSFACSAVQIADPS
jgi:hypothetical protein